MAVLRVDVAVDHCGPVVYQAHQMSDLVTPHRCLGLATI